MTRAQIRRTRALLIAGASLLSGACEVSAPVQLVPRPLPPQSSAPLPPRSIRSTGSIPFDVWPAGTVIPVSTFEVRNSRGDPVIGVEVQCQVSGGGAITLAVASTDSSGVASCGEWTLGSAPGTNTLTARVASVAAATFSIVGAPASPAFEEGRYRLDRFNGGPLPAPLVVSGTEVLVTLERAELLVKKDGSFEVSGTVRARNQASTTVVRATGTIASVGAHFSLTGPGVVSRSNDTWALALANGELLVAGDDEFWPLGPNITLFRHVR